ncbi:MAG: D-2-hydroxyacid dehydrogenase [Anaerolineales bacterium]
MKILILSKYAPIYREEIQAAQPGVEILLPGDSGADEAEIALGEPLLLREYLPRLKRLRWIQSTFAGVEPLLQAGLRRDYTLTNARGVFGGLMSEYIFGYLLAHERKIFQRWQAQREKRWDDSLTGTLRGKTLGLLGVGSIGAALAQTAKYFGMTVRGFTRASEACPQVDEYFHPPLTASFAEGLDYLVSVLPNTPGTQRVVDAALLAALPQRALFINVGRGSAVDEAALVSALEAGAISGAVLDVTGQEPLPAESPLWGVKNLLLTFHTSAPSFPKELAQMFLDNYRRYAAGEPLRHVVNFEAGY